MMVIMGALGQACRGLPAPACTATRRPLAALLLTSATVALLAWMGAADRVQAGTDSTVVEQEELSLAAALNEARERGPAFAALRREEEKAALAARRQVASDLPRIAFSTSTGVGSGPVTALPGFPPRPSARLQLDWTVLEEWRLQAAIEAQKTGEGSRGGISFGVSRQWPGVEGEGESSTSNATSQAADTGSDTTGGLIASELAARERRNHALLGVVEAWYAARYAEAELAVRRELLAVAEWEYQAALRRRDDGGGSLRELLTAEDALRQAREEERSAFAQYLAAWQKLAMSLGREPEPMHPVRWVDDLDWAAVTVAVRAELGVQVFPGEVIPTVTLLPGDLGERLLARRSSGLQAQEVLREAEKRLSAARSARGWQVSISASLGLDVQERQAPSESWQVMVTLAHPLYDPLLVLEEEAARLRFEEARQAVEARRDELLSQVVSSWQRAQNAFRAMEDARLAAERSSATREVARARYDAGLVAWNDLRRAEIAVVQAANRLQAAESEYRLALLQLADALGLDAGQVLGREQSGAEPADSPRT